MSRPTAAFSATLEVELAHEPGTLGRLCTAIGDVGGNIRSLRGFTATGGSLREEVVVDAASETHVEDICEAVNGLEGIKVINAVDRTFKIHEGGKLETIRWVERLQSIFQQARILWELFIILRE